MDGGSGTMKNILYGSSEIQATSSLNSHRYQSRDIIGHRDTDDIEIDAKSTLKLDGESESLTVGKKACGNGTEASLAYIDSRAAAAQARARNRGSGNFLAMEN